VGHDTIQDGLSRWFATHTLGELTDLVTDRGQFGTAERAIVARVLNILEAEKRSQQQKAQIEQVLYEVVWVRQGRPEIVPIETPGRWLILADAGGLGALLAEVLTASGVAVTLLPAGTDRTTLVQVLTAVADHERPWRGVVHLWALDLAAEPEAATLLESQEQTIGTLLLVMQTVAAFEGPATPRVWVVTQQAQAVLPADQVAVAQTPLWGMGRTVTLEYGERWGGLIDLGIATERTAAAQMLAAELRQGVQEIGEEQIAYRQGQRYVARLVPVQPAARLQALTLRAEGSYLITGGVGSLGLQTAQWLVEQGARHVLLLGRRGIQQPAQQTIFDGLAAKGATVKLVPVDVADEAAMTQLFAELAAGPVPLRGVIHAAGLLGYKALQDLTWTEVAAVLRPKVVGGWLLHRLTAALDLDFFVGYSSGAAIWGSKQQAHYGAANHFLDGLMAYRRYLGLPALSIAWGPWAGPDGLPSMATPDGQALLQAMGIRTFAAEEGLAIQAHLLQTDAVQVVAVAADWSRLQALYAMTKPRHFLDEITAASAKEAISPQQAEQTNIPAAMLATLAALPNDQRLDSLCRYVQQTVAQVLGIAQRGAEAAAALEMHTGFADLGMDSLMALELRRHLERGLGCTLPSTIAFEQPTVQELARYLLEHLSLAEQKSTSHSSVTSPRSPATSRLIRNSDEPIAVISIACRLPGADTPEAFWRLLQAGADLVREVPSTRWNVDEFYDPRRPMPGKMYTRAGAFLDNVDHFDPLFFGISPREALSMDPQHRLLLELGWEVLERAGLVPSQLAESTTGVFVGISGSDYGMATGIQEIAEMDLYGITSSASNAAAGRLAYTLGLQGPTMSIDSACSSSLVALHLACQSLRTGECDLALSGGVSLMLSPVGHIGLSQMTALASDGRCKTFDAAADGYGRGEGCGMVVLKRLSDAEADGDTIWAVIKGSAVNHNGFSSGFTVPNKRAYEKVIRQALTNAGVNADEICYIEAHGTGTALGDPIEIRALGAVFGAERATPLLVGSVKTNVGHLEAAAGITGFIKTVLALYHGQLPPHLHFRTPNPYIEWDEVAITVPTTAQPWPDRIGSRIAGISSFGISGTNAHVIVAAPERDTESQKDAETDEGAADGRRLPPATVERTRHLLALSAKHETALVALAQRYQAHLHDQPTVDLGDLCYTAAVGRNHFSRRLAIVAADREELQAKLALVAQRERVSGLVFGESPAGAQNIAFLFTGQGAQYVDMGRELYATQPLFRAAIEQCDAFYQQNTGESLLAVLYPEIEHMPHARVLEGRNSLDDTTYTQPALFALEYALATLWRAWGVQPDILIGHSVGEIAAACVAGVFSLEDGMKLTAARGRLMGALPHDGAMIAVTATEATVQQAIASYADRVAIAAVNGPTTIVISGQQDAVNAVAAALTTENDAGPQPSIKTLTVSHAFHSPLMEPMLDDLRQVAQQLTYHAPSIPLISNLTGQLAGAEITTPDYWVRHVREAVRFADGIATLDGQNVAIFLEIGPKPVLLGMARDMLDHKATGAPRSTASTAALWLPSLRAGQNDWERLLQSLGELYVHGVQIDWAVLDQGYLRRKVALPTYPFQRQRYWLEPSRESAAKPANSHANDSVNRQASGRAASGEISGGFAQLLAAHTSASSLAQLADRLAGRKEFASTDKELVRKVLMALEAEERVLQLTAQMKTMIYEVAWEEQPLVLPALVPHASGRWLILTEQVDRNENSVGQAIAARLTALGERVELVADEAALTTLTPHLLDEATATIPLRGIVHLWALQGATASSDLEQEATALMASQQRNLGTLLYLVQTLSQQVRTLPKLWVVTRCAQQLVRDETVDATQTPLWGMGRVVTLEQNKLWGGLMDIDAQTPPTVLAQSLVADLLADQPAQGEEQIAYRQGRRYVARLVAAEPTPAAKPLVIDPDGVYLISGGLGGLGLQNANWLVEQGARHLILTGRGGVKVPEQQAVLDELRANGVTVTVAQVDVADVAEMTQLFKTISAAANNGGPPLRGIVHAAGVGGSQPLRTLQWADFEQLLRPKMIGGWLLHQLSAPLALDFFIAYSSGAAIWGSKTQAHYGAANHFLDGLMAYRHSQRLPGLSLAWGPWAVPGMATPELQTALATIGVHAFTPDVALAAQAHLLQSTATQILIANNDWNKLQTFYEIRRPCRFLARVVTPSTRTDSTEPAPDAQAESLQSDRSRILANLQGLPDNQRQQQIDAYVQTKIASVMRIPSSVSIDTGIDLMTLGLDSLMAIEIRNQISDGVGVTIPVTKLMDSLSIDGLARLIGEQLAARQPDSSPAAVLSLTPDHTAATDTADDRADEQTAEIEVRI
jgi:acyl transferase domain-containing protein